MRRMIVAVMLLTAAACGRGANSDTSSPASETPQVPESRAMGGAKSVTTFFIASRGLETGGNTDDVAAADAHCQMLADAEGSGDHMWRAYVSTSARERIGKGPWYNSAGDLVAANIEELHDGSGRIRISAERALTEKAEPVNLPGDGLLYCFALD